VRFHEYLAEKYGTVANLNEKWGVHFWSSAYTSFDEVPLPVGVPVPYPSLALEYARFVSRVNSDFARWRYELMKQLHPAAWVTTNFQGAQHTHTDIFEMGAFTDLYGINYYPAHHPELSLDYCRGSRGELIVLEQQSGAPFWRPGTPPGWMRLWTYQAIGHGASGINYFRWRTARWGQEEYWHGVLPHSGQPNRRYRELIQTGAELERMGDLISVTRPAAKVAIAMSYESRWAVASVASTQVMGTLFGTDALDPYTEAKAVHAALMDQNIPTDALDPREDLCAYRLVFASRLYVLDGPGAENLRRYVENGGVLALTPRSGVADEYNVIFNQPAPGPLREAAGVEVDDYTTLAGNVAIDALANGPQGVVQGTAWVDEINLNGAEVAARFASGWMAGMPAITVHTFGKGKVIYLGTLLRGANLDALVAWLTGLAGVEPCLVTPAGVRSHERRGKDYRLVFVLNFNDQRQVFSLGGTWREVLSDREVDELDLPPAGVAVLQKVNETS
jgi:beta-galactosidase